MDRGHAFGTDFKMFGELGGNDDAWCVRILHILRFVPDHVQCFGGVS